MEDFLFPVIGKERTMINITPYKNGLIIRYFDEKAKRVKEKTILTMQFEELTEAMALKCFKDCYFYKNFYEDIDDQTMCMKISRNNQIYTVLFDKEDFEKVDVCKWNIQIDNRDGRVYIRNSTNYGFLHRYLMTNEKFDFNKQDIIVDHINRDTLNCKKSNLRIVNNSLNQKNKSTQKNNTSGIPGVRYMTSINSWCCRWTDFEKKRHTRTFSVLKYGDNEAKQMAIELRKKMEAKYGYLSES
jgi:hypothetical protein